MARETLREMVAELGEKNSTPVLKEAVKMLLAILDTPEKFSFKDNHGQTSLTEITQNGLFPLSEVELQFTISTNGETPEPASLNVKFSLSRLAAGSKPEDFKMALMLNFSVPGKPEDRYDSSTHTYKEVPTWQITTVALPVDLDVSKKSEYNWRTGKEISNPWGGKHFVTIGRIVDQVKELPQGTLPKKIECRTWSGLKGELLANEA